MTTKTFKCYLAGPITGLTRDEAIDWRQKVIEKLPPEIQGYSPMRGKSFLSHLGALPPHGYETMPDIGEIGRIMASQTGINRRDFNDVYTSDAVFVNFLGAEKVSIGTVMEIAWAYAFRKPCVVVMEPEKNPHDHAMLRDSSTYITSTIENGIVLLKTLLLPVAH